MKRIFRGMGYLITFFLVSSLVAVLVLKYMPVYYTPLMVIRCAQQKSHGEEARIEHQWVPLSQMSHNLPQAVMASEDNLFLTHHGFDTKEIARAYLESQEGGRQRGASTISQQTAKNVFLWPGHSWVRKGLEAYFTVLIEVIWGKERIMEVYLNSVELGNGIYGVEAAAQHFWHKDAASVTRGQAALIASALPAPLKRDLGDPTGYMLKRRGQIVSLMGKIDDAPWGKRRD